MTLGHIKTPLGKAGACAILVCLTLSVSLLHARQDRAAGVSYTEAQAAQGKLGYEEHCAECHGFKAQRP
jgi:mono/diheme cytochrome c family protein